MSVRRVKPAHASPVFEKIQLERLKRCEETTQSARKAVEKSKELTQEARELIERIHRLREEADQR